MDAVATIIAGISIHSLRMEGDQIKVFDDARKQDISIHSLRMEGDQETDFSDVLGGYFNPLPPHGGRPRSSFCAIIIIRFQSTPSAWRETGRRGRGTGRGGFQSTPSAWRETNETTRIRNC